MAVLWSLGGLAAVGQWQLVEALTWQVALTLACALLAGGLALGAVRAEPAGMLRWDGENWLWQDAATAAPEVHLDLQSVMLVRSKPDAGPGVWLWLERRQAPARWDDLRRAVWAPKDVGAGQGDASSANRVAGGLA